jgi:hypothetical protein
MTQVAKFNFDYTSTALGARWFRFERRGGKCGCAAFSFKIGGRARSLSLAGELVEPCRSVEVILLKRDTGKKADIHFSDFKNLFIWL